VDAGEDPARAAEREALEETSLQVAVTALFDVYARAAGSEGADILIVYRARVTGGLLAPGDDASEVGFFSPAALPELAFASTQQVIARWSAELARGSSRSPRPSPTPLRYEGHEPTGGGG
jgi:ADP-ribose pyrophosphatase YjhB (NUDIX family)